MGYAEGRIRSALAILQPQRRALIRSRRFCGLLSSQLRRSHSVEGLWAALGHIRWRATSVLSLILAIPLQGQRHQTTHFSLAPRMRERKECACVPQCNASFKPALKEANLIGRFPPFLEPLTSRTCNAV